MPLVSKSWSLNISSWWWWIPELREDSKDQIQASLPPFGPTLLSLPHSCCHGVTMLCFCVPSLQSHVLYLISSVPNKPPAKHSRTAIAVVKKTLWQVKVHYFSYAARIPFKCSYLNQEKRHFRKLCSLEWRQKDDPTYNDRWASKLFLQGTSSRIWNGLMQLCTLTVEKLKSHCTRKTAQWSTMTERRSLPEHRIGLRKPVVETRKMVLGRDHPLVCLRDEFWLWGPLCINGNAMGERSSSHCFRSISSALAINILTAPISCTAFSIQWLVLWCHLWNASEPEQKCRQTERPVSPPFLLTSWLEAWHQNRFYLGLVFLDSWKKRFRVWHFLIVPLGFLDDQDFFLARPSFDSVNLTMIPKMEAPTFLLYRKRVCSLTLGGIACRRLNPCSSCKAKIWHSLSEPHGHLNDDKEKYWLYTSSDGHDLCILISSVAFFANLHRQDVLIESKVPIAFF